MSVKKEVELILADTEERISQLTGCHSKLRLHLAVDMSQQHELVLAACEIWQVEPASIAQRNRHQHKVAKRQLLAWLLREKTLLTLKQIAAHIGYCGHGDVVHGLQKAQANLSINDKLTLEYYEQIKHLFQ